MMTYIYQNANWPNFIWNNDLINKKADRVRYLQGYLLGRIESLGFEDAKTSLFHHLTDDVINTSAIEGENLDIEMVRSSIAQKLGLQYGGMTTPIERSVDGIVTILLDATLNYSSPLSENRLFYWHKELFPLGVSGFSKIKVGDYRTDENGPMQVVSGYIGREKVHFSAIDAKNLKDEMNTFYEWFNKNEELNPIIKAAIAHLWFITLHPFDDGNGRIARSITDMLLARSEKKAQRFYSMSTSIKEMRKSYYDILEKTQKGSLDITEWLIWFLDCLEHAITNSQNKIEKTIIKSEFWNHSRNFALNQRQTKMINMLLDGFEGKLTTSKWAKINKCSQDTAYRDILDLMNKKILHKSENESGRSTNYELIFPNDKPI